MAQGEVTPEAEVTPEVVKGLSSEEKKEVAHEAVRGLAAQDKRAVANTVLQTLPAGATDVRRDVAKEALQTLPAGATDARKDVAKEALQSLPAQDQMDVAESLGGPDQQVTNKIWLTVIRSFCIVFILAAAMLFVSVYMGLDNTQLVLTVFTTVTGVLAGFISGRASTHRPSG